VQPAAELAARSWLPRALRPFASRDYRLLVASLAASLLGSGMWLVAIVWQVIALGGGPSELSLVTTAASLGLVLSVLGGGVAADRLPKRALLIAVELTRVVTAAAAGTLAVTGGLRLWQLAVIAFVVGAAEGFFFPAYTALLPGLLPPDELLAANGVEGTLRPVAQQAAGPALAGLLVGAFAPSVAMLASAGCYVLALLALLVMRGGDTRAEPSDGSLLRDLGEGFGYMFRTGWMFATLAFACIYVLLLIGPLEVLMPFAVRDQTGGGPAGFSLVLGAFGVGGAVGSVVTASMPLPRRYLSVMLLAWGFGALPMAVIGVTRELWLMTAAAFVVGYAMDAGSVIWGTLLQRRVPPHLLGRVSSLDFFVSLALMPVSMALAGPIGESLGVPMTFVLAATIPVLLSVAALLVWRLPRDEIAHPLEQVDDPVATEQTTTTAP
jgi:MFS family permease